MNDGKATVVDVRMKVNVRERMEFTTNLLTQDQFEKGHVKGAINVPMFRDSTGSCNID